MDKKIEVGEKIVIEIKNVGGESSNALSIGIQTDDCPPPERMEISNDSGESVTQGGSSAERLAQTLRDVKEIVTTMKRRQQEYHEMATTEISNLAGRVYQISEEQKALNIDVTGRINAIEEMINSVLGTSGAPNPLALTGPISTAHPIGAIEQGAVQGEGKRKRFDSRDKEEVARDMKKQKPM